jgi:sortase A
VSVVTAPSLQQRVGSEDIVPRATPGRVAAPQRKLAARGAAILTALLALLVVYAYWVTEVEESRSQVTLLAHLQRELAAPPPHNPGAAPPIGAPVGLLEIPSLGVEQVFVEGAGASQLAKGPGHLPASALPGLAGDSIILGRATTSGAPFAHLDALRAGDEILLTTGLGRYSYVVVGANQSAGATALTLMTSAGGWFSNSTVEVHATLDGQPAPVATQTRPPAVDPAEQARAGIEWFGDAGAWLDVALWLALLAGALAAMWWGYQRRLGRLTYLFGTPVVVALLFCLLGATSRLLPVTR